jgi:sterol 3beta-glucosyltransferase
LRITIFTTGTRGDVHPFLPLGKRLQEDGFTVRLAVGSEFRAAVESAGMEFVPVEMDYNRILLSPEIQAAFEKGGANFLLVMLRVFPRVFRMYEQALEDAWRAAPGSDAVLFTANGPWGFHVAEALRVPAAYVCFQPAARSAELPNAVAMAKPGPRIVNRMSHIGFEWATWLPFRGRVNRWRKQTLRLPPSPLLPPFPRPGQTVLGAYSPTLSPRPGDWPETWQVTGFWRSTAPAGWRPPDDLADFLAAGPPPVYLGFGSMISRDASRITGVLRTVLANGRVRAVVTRGWNDLSPRDASDRVYLLDQAPHDWLFPRMAAVIHHGGGGTTAAALSAGVPSMAVPFSADQPFWGERLRVLGVGPRPIAYRDLTAQKLSAAIGRLTEDPEMRAAAKSAAEKIRTENGVEKAVELIRGLM